MDNEALQQAIDKGRQDPVWFVENFLNLKLWKKQNQILEAVRDNREVAVSSSNASGKSFVASALAHWYLICNEDSVVITTAPTFRQVESILWRNIRAMAVPKFYPANSVTKTRIDISPKWFAMGLSTDKPEALQGIHSENLLIIVDEASAIPELIWQAIDGLTYKKMLMIGNPIHNQGRFKTAFDDPDVKRIRISAFDTPNVEQGREVIKGLITLDDVDMFKNKYGVDSDVYRVRVLGKFPLQDTDSFISFDVLDNAMNRTVESMPQWEKKLGVDVARFGDDRSVFIVRQDKKIIRKEAMAGADLMEVAGKVLSIARDEGVLPQNVFIDEIGLGSGVIDRLREQGWNVTGVNVAKQAEDNEHYANLRAELAFSLREWLNSADIPRDDDFFQCSDIKYKFNSAGKIILEPKADMKKRGKSSPDTFDALALTFAPVDVVTYGGASAPVYSDMDSIIGKKPTDPEFQGSAPIPSTEREWDNLCKNIT